MPPPPPHTHTHTLFQARFFAAVPRLCSSRKRWGRRGDEGDGDCAVVMLVAEAELAVDTPAEREQLARLDEHDRVCRPARHALGRVTCRALLAPCMGPQPIIFRWLVPLRIRIVRACIHATSEITRIVSTNHREQACLRRYSVPLHA